jgi:hypothetical protein
MKKTYSMPGQLLGAFLVTIALATPSLAKNNTVTLPAGSVDGLAAAIASAGPHGTVIVESGLHRESGTVTVNIPVAIIGEAGAIIEGSTVPNGEGGPPDFIEPVLHINGTRGVLVQGVTIQPAPEAIGNTAVLVQNSPKTTIRDNAIVDHEYGIVVQGGDHALIEGNRIEDSIIFGVLNINGRHVRVIGNEILRTGVFGIWLCDRGGQCMFNVTNDGFIGIMLCRFAEGDAVLPDGSSDGASSTATQWHVANNESTGNGLFGILVTDGANNNTLNNNAASGNNVFGAGVPDILLDSEFTDDNGNYFPPSSENVVALGSHKDVTVVDLGVDNVVSGDAD